MPYADRTKQIEYQRKWMARRRQRFMATLGPCVQCGSTENLELHHVDRATKTEHKIWSWSPARLRREMKKCVALCRKCHKEETRKQLKELAATRPDWGHNRRYQYQRSAR
jgi:hypothetical protein